MCFADVLGKNVPDGGRCPKGPRLGGRMLEEQAGGQSVRKGLTGHHEDSGCCPEGNGALSH